ncbi:TIGR02391 family protein [Variovorax ginsengisoli]|uniref:Uncharacterized protein (TIGR02391 family) n=1 Tax=Variovorax ginsengisoli TaxID=363844 RepID=A0ABT9SGK8_9BURK|nr:TIGR02391 family protein [Variovorax ginsengisoli]MDP9902941.1 uncharacterized protein (TIGR02391 family) [Variovorax ginsengisoli]
MATALDLFEQIVRRTPAREPIEEAAPTSNGLPVHPFELRNVHVGFPPKVRKLFDDGHGAEATFHAFKYVEKVVQKHAGSTLNGEKLMMAVFNEAGPAVKLNGLANASEQDEQRGYRFIFSGAIVAIRNPGGHEITLSDDPDVCLDHLAFASLLLRRLERSGYK